MKKLLILNRNVLVQVVRHPLIMGRMDQQFFLPGVEDAIRIYAGNPDWLFAVVANYDECMVRNMSVSSLTPGMYILVGEEHSQVGAVSNVNGTVYVNLNQRIKGKPSFIASENEFVRCYEKSIDIANQEMIWLLAKLNGIIQDPKRLLGWLCLNNGESAWRVDSYAAEQQGMVQWLCYEETLSVRHGDISYRLPGHGMLILAKEHYSAEQIDEVLVVGAQPGDSVAAHVSGDRFMWAQEWRRGIHARSKA